MDLYHYGDTLQTLLLVFLDSYSPGCPGLRVLFVGNAEKPVTGSELLAMGSVRFELFGSNVNAVEEGFLAALSVVVKGIAYHLPSVERGMFSYVLNLVEQCEVALDTLAVSGIFTVGHEGFMPCFYVLIPISLTVKGLSGIKFEMSFGCTSSARKLFDEMPQRKFVSFISQSLAIDLRDLCFHVSIYIALPWLAMLEKISLSDRILQADYIYTFGTMYSLLGPKRKMSIFLMLSTEQEGAHIKNASAKLTDSGGFTCLMAFDKILHSSNPVRIMILKVIDRTTLHFRRKKVVALVAHHAFVIWSQNDSMDRYYLILLKKFFYILASTGFCLVNELKRDIRFSVTFAGLEVSSTSLKTFTFWNCKEDTLLTTNDHAELQSPNYVAGCRCLVGFRVGYSHVGYCCRAFHSLKDGETTMTCKLAIISDLIQGVYLSGRVNQAYAGRFLSVINDNRLLSEWYASDFSINENGIVYPKARGILSPFLGAGWGLQQGEDIGQQKSNVAINTDMIGVSNSMLVYMVFSEDKSPPWWNMYIGDGTQVGKKSCLMDSVFGVLGNPRLGWWVEGTYATDDNNRALLSGYAHALLAAAFQGDQIFKCGLLAAPD